MAAPHMHAILSDRICEWNREAARKYRDTRIPPADVENPGIEVLRRGAKFGGGVCIYKTPPFMWVCHHTHVSCALKGRGFEVCCPS